MIPPKKKRKRSGILRGPRREWYRHREFLRKQRCVVKGCRQPTEVSHIRTAANSGMGLKPHDSFAVPMCREHHEEYHRGSETFEAKYKLNLLAIAAMLSAKSPDREMLESLLTEALE